MTHTNRNPERDWGRHGNAAPRRVALIHAGFYVVTGIWPFVSILSFMRVTGPKTDIWLVKTVGALVTVIGVVLALAGYRGRVTPEVITLAVGSATGLAAIDAVYVARRRIAPVYLLDAAAELGFVAAWVWATLHEQD